MKIVIDKSCFSISERQHSVAGTEIQCDLVSVWLGEPEDPESEHILTVGREYIPALIAALRSVPSHRS